MTARPRLLIAVTVVAMLSACADGPTTPDRVRAPADSATGPVTLPNLRIVSGDSQSAPASAPIPLFLQVRAIDAFGDPVEGVTVNFALASGRGGISGNGAVTDTAGVAMAGAWTLGPTAGPQYLIAWAAGYEQVVFTAFAQPSPPDDGREHAAGESVVYVRNGAIWQATDSQPLRLLKPANEIQSVDVSRRGSVAFVAGPTNQVCVAEPNDSEPRCVSTGYYNINGLAWSPDGSQVVFSGQPASSTCPSTPPCFVARMDLLALDATAMTVRPLVGGVPDVQDAIGASWSPDGSVIAFANGGGLWSVKPDGSQLRQIKSRVGGPYAVRAVRWSPDGHKFSLSLSDESSCDWECSTAIGSVDVDGSGLRMVATGLFSVGEFVGSWPHGAPVWSPDGQRLAYGRSDCDSAFGCAESVAVVSADGGAPTLFLQNATLLAWRDR